MCTFSTYVSPGKVNVAYHYNLFKVYNITLMATAVEISSKDALYSPSFIFLSLSSEIYILKVQKMPP